MKKPSPGILIIGSSNTDMVIQTDHFPKPGETIIGGQFYMYAGGKGANQAVAAARLGGKVAFISKVGNDIFGKQTIQNLEKEGIDISGLLTDPGLPSGIAQILVDKNAENCIVVAPGSNMSLLREDVEKNLSLLTDAESLLMQLEIPLATILYAASKAFKAGKKVIVNPAPAIDLPDELFQYLYLITPNESEAEFITGINVRGESDLIESIKRVWSSTFNARSLSARKRAGAPLETDPIGVAVLKMVNARTAGVLFTADPNTGDTSRMIIEANWGLGESVVSGEALPDVFVLEKESLEIIDRKLGTKGRLITLQERGTVEKETPAEKCGSFCLCDEEVKEIGKLGKVLEAHFGVPQDTEWAVDADRTFPENVILLQTRAEVIAQQKKPIDQVIDMMISRF